MVSLYIHPIYFKSTGELEILKENPLEWKKQIATVSIKKGMSINEYVQLKYGEKVSALINDIADVTDITDKNKKNKIKNSSLVYGFQITDVHDFYMFNVVTDNKQKVFLHYELHLPKKEELTIYNDCSINENEQYVEFVGEFIGFCVNRENYQLVELDINTYVQYCKKDLIDEEYISDDEDCDDGECEDDDNSQMTDNYDSDDAKDEEEDEEEDDEDGEDDEVGEDEEDGEDNDDGEELEDEEELEDDIELDDNDGEDIETEDGEDGEDNDTDGETLIDDENQTAVDDDENVGGDEDFIEFELEQESESKTPAKRKRAKGAARLMKLSANTDVSVIMNVLKMEQQNTFTSDVDLNDKRKLVILIFKQLAFPIKMVQMIEKGIYNYAIDRCISKQSIPLWENPEFLDTYISKSKNLYTNLNTKSYVKNTKLYESVKNGSIKPYELAFIDTYKLFPEKWQDIIEEKAKTEKMIKESVLETATDIFQCRRCKQRKTIYCEVQTRSSDEPMTKFITCVVCGLKWKQY